MKPEIKETLQNVGLFTLGLSAIILACLAPFLMVDLFKFILN